MNTTKPNILFIMTDQLSANAVGAFGNSTVKTPNMDKLASEGVSFSNCHTPSPICGPARWSLMTGLHVHNHRGWDNGSALSSEIPTFAHVLTLAGYETVICSRMHFNGIDQYHGFEKRLATEHNNPIDYPAEPLWGDKPEQPVFAGERPTEYDEDYPFNHSIRAGHDDWVLEKNIEYLKSGQWGKRPFMLTASFLAPHPSVRRRKEYLEIFHEYLDMGLEVDELTEEDFNSLHPHTKRLIAKGKEKAFAQSKEEKRRYLAEYYSRVTYFDRQVGELIETLEKEGLRDNTVIVLTSDHGDDAGRFGYWGKVSFYDNVVKVPLIVSMPPAMRKTELSGSLRKENVSLLDLFPTFAELAQAEAFEFKIDGHSLLPLLNEKTPKWHNTVLSEYFGQYARRPMFMLKKDDLKFNYYLGEDPELFDLAKDPDEKENLAENPEYSALLKELEKELRQVCNPENLYEEYVQSSRQRTFIARATKASIQTKLRIKKYIHEYRAAWDEPTWDDNKEQSRYESHLE